MKRLYCLASIGCFLLATPTTSPAQNAPAANDLATPSYRIEATTEFRVFPVQLNSGDRNVIPNTLVRGREDGGRAIDFADWLLPYDAVIQALNYSSFVMPNGQIELQSLRSVVTINPQRLRNDAELGPVLSIQEIEALFGVKVEFDLNQYAIVFRSPGPPLPSLPNHASVANEPAVQLEGLPQISAPQGTVSAIEQRANISGAGSAALESGGDLIGVGTVLGSSWFVRLNQPKLQDRQTWSLAEFRIQHLSNRADYILGSQPPFWRSKVENQYWGFTTIQRTGFKPLPQLNGESDPRLRLQAARIGRTISGQAKPGTLVRLMEATSDRPVAEVMVDSSGIYRFDNVVGSNYRVGLYPDGRLTAQPQIEDITFTTVPGQLPSGASALVFSGGFERHLSADEVNLLGNFSDFQGGVAHRWGLSDNLTVGIGAVYDQAVNGLAELFFQPLHLPIQIAFSALAGDDLDFNSDISFAPSPNFTASLQSDRLSSRFNLHWQVLPQLTLLGSYDTREDAVIGGELALKSSDTAATFVRATLDAENHFQWKLQQRLGRLELRQEGNEIRTLSELTYSFSPTSSINSGHAFILNYETKHLESENESNDFATIFWRYRSPQRAIDRNYRWGVELGYGTGSLGSGIIVAVQTTVLPGLLLEARYQAVSLTSDESSFRIELVPSFNLQRGVTPGDRNANYLRSLGGLLIQSFYDRNNNGRRDINEAFYTDPQFVLINNKPIQSFRPEVRGNQILVRLSPDTYRLDFDPDKLPPDWEAAVSAYAVEVVPGSHTPVMVRLIPITDAKQRQKIEASKNQVSTSTSK